MKKGTFFEKRATKEGRKVFKSSLYNSPPYELFSGLFFIMDKLKQVAKIFVACD